MKKIISTILVLALCITMLTACSGANNAGNTSNTNDAMSLIQNSSQYYNNAKNVKLEHNIKSCMIFNSMFTGLPVLCATQTTATTVMYNSPFSFSNTTSISIDKSGDDGSLEWMTIIDSDMKQYAAEDNGKITIYQLLDNKWSQVELDNTMFIANDTLGLSYITNYDKFVVDGKVIGEEKIDEIDTIKAEYTLNDDYLMMFYNKSGFYDFAKLINEADPESEIKKMMTGVKLNVWFNKNNQEVIQTTIDYTKILEDISKVYIDDNKDKIGEENYKVLKEYLNGVELVNTVKYSNVDNNEAFALPEEAKNAEKVGQ